MDFRIYRDPKALESTGFMEIGPGRYSGKHWQSGFIFVWEDAFGFAEGILAKHFPQYDHFGMNDIPRTIGHDVIQDWRRAAEHIHYARLDKVRSALRLEDALGKHLPDHIEANRRHIANLLDELANACEDFYRVDEFICVLGM